MNNSINKHIVAKRFEKSKESYKNEAVVQKNICEEFIAALQNCNFNPKTILEFGCGTGFLTEQIVSNFTPETYFINDISEELLEQVYEELRSSNTTQFETISGDAECIEFPHHLDAIVSTSTIQWFASTEDFFKKSATVLNTNGILAVSTFGPNNLSEIYALTKTGLDYKSFKEIEAELNKDFTILYSHKWNQTLWFKDPIEILKHIQNTGVGGLSNNYFGKKELHAFTNAYIDRFIKNDKFPLTYEPYIFIAQKK